MDIISKIFPSNTRTVVLSENKNLQSNDIFKHSHKLNNIIEVYPIVRCTGAHTATADRGELVKDKLCQRKRTFPRYGVNRTRHLSTIASGTCDPQHKVNQSTGKRSK